MPCPAGADTTRQPNSAHTTTTSANTPVQQSLDATRRTALVINPSSRRNFQADSEAQLRFIPIQISSFFLEPLNQAFRQLTTADQDRQITRLPRAAAQMAGIFKQMNDGLRELEQVANTDVKRRLGEVRARLESFRAQLVSTTNELAQSITTGIIDTLQSTLPQLLTRSLGVQALSVPGRFAQPLQALGALQATEAALGQAGITDVAGIQAQISRLVEGIVTDALSILSSTFLHKHGHDRLCWVSPPRTEHRLA
jgi:hypothetical protein